MKNKEQKCQTCPKCKETKNISDFGIASGRPSGHTAKCKVCQNRYARSRARKIRKEGTNDEFEPYERQAIKEYNQQLLWIQASRDNPQSDKAMSRYVRLWDKYTPQQHIERIKKELIVSINSYIQ